MTGSFLQSQSSGFWKILLAEASDQRAAFGILKTLKRFERNLCFLFELLGVYNDKTFILTIAA